MASRIDYSQNRKLYVGTTAEVTVADGNAIIAGNVGIGTTSPSSTLTVDGTIEILSDDTGGANEGGHLTLRASSAGTKRWNIDNYADSDLRFFTQDDATSANGDVKMIILDSGNVGIGTTSPSNKLEVVGSNALRIHDGTDQGSIFFRGDRNDVYIKESSYQLLFGAPSGMLFELDTNNNDGDVFNVMHRGSSRFYINGVDGNVGIGTTSPGENLSIVGESTHAQLSLQAGPTTYAGYKFNMRSQAAEMGFYMEMGGTKLLKSYGYNNADSVGLGILNNEDLIYMKAGGNVGIGTTSPGVKLSLRRESNGNIFSINRPASNTSALYAGVSGNDTSFYSNNGVYKLGINNPVGTGGEIPFITMSPTNRYTTFTAGNVGIGTTSPGAKLDVQPTATNRKVTKIANDVMSTYFYNTQADAILAWTCGSYYQAEVVITANQTNGGTTANLYIRGIWSNNHTSHHWDELEHIGSLPGSTITMSVGQNGSTTASGRLELDFNYINGSFSQLNVRVTDFYGSHSYTIT